MSEELFTAYSAEGRVQHVLHPGSPQEYRILIAAPNGEAPDEGYPVLVALDGHASFQTLADAVRLQTRKPHGYEPAVVVGIGYPSCEPFDTERRCHDFTMQVDPASLPERPDGKSWPANGGADLFLDRLEREILPLVDRLYPTNPRRRSLHGHSLGGLLVLHALFARTGLFSHYAAGSPSVWWGDYAVLAERDRFLSAAESTAGDQVHLLVTVGGSELDHMMEDAEQLADSLKPLEGPGFRCAFVKFADEDHVSVLPASLGRLPKFALSDQN